MKAIIIVLVALSTSLATFGQSKAITLNGSDATTDTITNAGTTYLTSPSLASFTTGKFSVSLLTANVSGTSTFKAILQGSNDGTNYTDIHQVAGTNGILCDTLQVTAAAPAYWCYSIYPGSKHSVTDSTYLFTNVGRYLYIRLKCVGTGTQSTIISGKILPIN